MRVRALDAWRDHEQEAKEKALREWCAEQGLAVEGRERRAQPTGGLFGAD